MNRNDPLPIPGPPIRPQDDPPPDPPWQQSPVHPDYLSRVVDGMRQVKHKSEGAAYGI